MTTLFTIGFTKKSLEEFANLLKENKITVLVDTRLNRTSQLSGFAKEQDLRYTCEEFLGIKYEAIPEFAPEKEFFKTYRKDKNWKKYEEKYLNLIKERDLRKFKNKVLDEKERVCLLCSESEPDNCHRRLLAKFFSSLGKGIEVIDL